MSGVALLRDVRSEDKPGLVIGLVNNMPPAAFRATELHFGHLLQDAAAALPTRPRIHLRRFASHGAEGRCEDLDTLWRSRLDGLIVTGAQPRAGAMVDEPVWPVLRRVADWAAANTAAAIWSCLAAHAAVFHLDGLPRQRLPVKLAGVFRCERAATDGLMAGAATHWPVPHSRYFDLDAAALRQAGYQILSRGPGSPAGTNGADMFEKKAGRSLFLMLQGHPEYAADSLLREYRRDLRQFAADGQGIPPPVPVDYFEGATLDRLAAVRTQSDARDVLQTAFCDPAAPRWRSAAVDLFGRWLGQLAQNHAGYAHCRLATS